MIKTFKLRMYPTEAQKSQMYQNIGACRWLWNQLLDMQQTRYKNGGKYVNAYAMNYLLTQLKRQYPWLRDAESTSLLSVTRNLDNAYKRAFKHIGGRPKFKSKRYAKRTIESQCVHSNIAVIDADHVKLPKLGLMRVRGTMPVGKIKTAIIRYGFTGIWSLCIVVECDVALLAKTNDAVGLDMGVADLVITSDAVKYPTIRFDKRLAKRKHYWEKRLARRRAAANKAIAWDKHLKIDNPRCLDDFANYRKARVMVAKYNAKIANQRRDYLHKISKRLVQQYDVIKLEDLKTKNLLKNHHLARAVANQSWRELRLMLEYKAAWYGKQVVVVNPYKTSQICSNCGYDDGKHELNVRQWQCPACGVCHDRDINAAVNILHA